MFRLMKKIRQDETTEILRRTWLQYIPLMATGIIRQMTFEEYKARNTMTVDMRSNADILAEVQEIRKEMKGE